MNEFIMKTKYLLDKLLKYYLSIFLMNFYIFKYTH